MGYDTTIGRKEYYRTSPPNSSFKFFWLNGKAPRAPKNGRIGKQFQKRDSRSQRF